jgi:hypothetical protein
MTEPVTVADLLDQAKADDAAITDLQARINALLTMYDGVQPEGVTP